MTEHDIDDLFEHNMQMISRMNTASGSMVKAVIQGLELNGPAYVKLTRPEKHRVNYTLQEGDQKLLYQLGRTLGVIVTDTYIEAYH